MWETKPTRTLKRGTQSVLPKILETLDQLEAEAAREAEGVPSSLPTPDVRRDSRSEATAAMMETLTDRQREEAFRRFVEIFSELRDQED